MRRLAKGGRESLKIVAGGPVGRQDCFFLKNNELFDSLTGESEHGGHLIRGEGTLFAAALKFDEIPVLGHDNVEIDGGIAVLGVVEVEDGFVLVDAGADGGDEFGHGEVLELALGHEAVEGDGDGDASAGDGGGAGAAVGLQDIAVDPESAFAEFLEVDDGAKGASDETLDLRGASVELAAVDVAGFSVVGGVGEHGILGGDPAAFDLLILHPTGDVFLDGGGANDAGIAEGNENGSGGIRRDVWNKRNRAEFGNRASIGSVHMRS